MRYWTSSAQSKKVLALSLLAIIGIGLAAPSVGSYYFEAQCGVARALKANQANDRLLACVQKSNPRAQSAAGLIHLSAAHNPNLGPELWGLPDDAKPADLMSEGWRLLEAAAMSGDRNAQSELGYALTFGELGKEQNLEVGLEMLRLADGRGDPLAPYNLARLQFAGSQSEHSLELAKVALRRSAYRGYKPAICTLFFLSGAAQDSFEIGLLSLAARVTDYGAPCAPGALDVAPEFRTKTQ